MNAVMSQPRPNWRESKLDDLLLKVIDNRGKNPPYVSSGYEVIETGCISGNGKYPDYSLIKKYVDEHTYLNWFRSGHPRKDDLLIITVGNGIGSVSMMQSNRGVLTQNLIGLRFNESSNSNFFYYFLNQEAIQDFLRSMNIGSAQPSLKVPHILNLEVPFPPLPEQKAIASVLSSFDDKIDLLHRQNKTLEAMAETLFRQWFVKEAQEDWEKVPIGGMFEISSGKGIKKEKLDDVGLFPVLGANGEIGRTNDYLYNEKLIFTGRVGTIGNVFIVDGNKVWLSDNTLVFRKIRYFYFVYFFLKVARLADYNAGSTQPLIRQSDIKEISVILPSDVRLNDFECHANEVFRKITANDKQIQTLETLRDTLLPKLMSGEVRVAV